VYQSLLICFQLGLLTNALCNIRLGKGLYLALLGGSLAGRLGAVLVFGPVGRWPFNCRLGAV